MGTQIVISAKQMRKAGFKAEQELVRENELCSYCSGTYPECPDCAGHGDGRAVYRTVFVKGETRLGSYSDDCFVADCRDGGNNEALFARLGLFELKHRFI